MTWFNLKHDTMHQKAINLRTCSCIRIKSVKRETLEVYKIETMAPHAVVTLCETIDGDLGAAIYQELLDAIKQDCKVTNVTDLMSRIEHKKRVIAATKESIERDA